MVVPICKEQTDLALRDLKCKKIGTNVFKTIYFIWATIWGYQVMKNEYYLPTYLGGNGDYNQSL